MIGRYARRYSEDLLEDVALLLQACLNGNRTRAEHNRLPVTAGELAADARLVADAGAHALHIHPRSGDGSESVHPDDVGAAVAAIRDACPGLPVGVTTGAWIEPDPNLRLEAVRAWHTLPDYASVNFSEDGAVELARLLLERGVEVEAGLAALEDVRALAESGLAPSCLRALVEIEDEVPVNALEAAGVIVAELHRGSIAIPQLHHGSGVATWAVLEAGVRSGHDIRIGLEDTLVLEGGEPAQDNAQLVATAAALVDNVSAPDRSNRAGKGGLSR